MITDPQFYLAAVPAVMLFGISKGGFGSGLGVISVPLMAIAISPDHAAAILLPILCLMDVVGLWHFRGRWVWPEVRILLPASALGLLAGTLLFEFMNPSRLRQLLGTVAVVFTLQHWLQARLNRVSPPVLFGPAVGAAAGAVAGFTSFIAHSGGPPITMYLLRRGIDRTQFVATMVVFFAVLNYIKLVPYTWLGLFDRGTLLTALLLAPLAPLGMGLGIWLHERVTDRVFFRIAYLMLFLVGVKLIYDGLA